MVVIDNIGIPSKKKAATSSSAATQAPQPSDEPPPYNAQRGTYHLPTPGESRQPLLPSSNANPGGSGGASGYVVGGRGEPAWRRFGKALFFAVVIYVLFATFLGSWVWNVRSDKVGSYSWPESYPVPGGLETSQCLGVSEWGKAYEISSLTNTTGVTSEYPMASSTRFTLPVKAQSLYLLSRGAFLSGSVDIMTSASQAQDSVSVFITAKYYRESTKKAIKVCRISRRNGEEGVGLFTPKYLGNGYRREQVSFETLLVFPESDIYRKGSPFVVKNLETDVSNMLHRVHGEQLKFTKLRLQGSNAPISATSLSVEEGVIKTANGGISGTFNGTKSLDISTSNGPVMVIVKMSTEYHVPEASRLSIKTSNAPLEARIELFSNSRMTNEGPYDPNSIQPTFNVETITANGRLQADFWHQPSDSILRYHGKSSNGYAKAQMHPAYQGRFEIRTSNLSPQLEVREENPSDPSGRGRTRKVQSLSSTRGRRTGYVEWVGGKAGPGAGNSQVVLETSNSHALLVL